MDDLQFRQLIERLDLSWAGYRKVRKGVKKRIARHIQSLGCRNMTEYLQELGKSDVVRQECDRLMTVSISRFFRDRGLWLTLGNEILPDLIEKQREKLRVWSAGCASGEEVYSFRILWDDMKKHFRHLPRLEIIGSDMNPDYLSRSRAGIYPRGSLREIEESLRPLYFEAEANGKRYAVKPQFKEEIVWREHHLLSDDPPGSDFHIIFLRNNLLTYYEDRLKKKGFRKVRESLTRSGFLIIGSHEKLPSESTDFIPLTSCSCVFRKRG
ncbi:CheR family methyltransferase [Desulfobacterales bacterium HSG2]|nr:CheR family methyltransferase [Desulfobacterales bacterium HSG2]